MPVATTSGVVGLRPPGRLWVGRAAPPGRLPRRGGGPTGVRGPVRIVHELGVLHDGRSSSDGMSRPK